MKKKYYNYFDNYARKLLHSYLTRVIIAAILLLISFIVHLIDTLIQQAQQ